MKHNGMGVIHQVFRKRIDRLEITDKVFAPVANVQPQQLLDNTYSLYEFISNLSGTKGLQSLAEKTGASLLAKLFSSGFVRIEPFQETDTPGVGAYGSSDGEKVFIGPNTAVIEGRKTTIPGGLFVDVPVGTQQLVFVEAWLQVVDPKTGLGLMAPAHRTTDRVVYPNGCRNSSEGVALSSVFSDIGIYHLHSAKPGELERLQWQWRLRSVFGVERIDHWKVKAQGPADEPGGLGFKERDGVFVSEEGSFVALPMFNIRRSVVLDIEDLRKPALALGFEGAVQRSGDMMTGDLKMEGGAGIVFGDRFKIAYNETEDSLDVTLV